MDGKIIEANSRFYIEGVAADKMHTDRSDDALRQSAITTKDNDEASSEHDEVYQTLESAFWNSESGEVYLQMLRIGDKLNHLKEIKDYLAEETFKYVVAELTAKHFTNLFIDRGLKVNKRRVLERTNLVLRNLGVEEVSYGFVRRIV
ncbi:hypothetical protein P4T04_15560 [Bacillus badius]|uniref:hypothetical protein n=1 Tax=Bacillus badius TaxID=1455 RepID=UPI002E235DDE|nr:hypothetical protein [Bacillus badius]